MAGKVVAGDYKGAEIHCILGQVIINPGLFNPNVTVNGRVASIELVTEQNKKKFIGAAGWGIVGALALGPLGALAGLLAGGNKKQICFACELKDGKRFMGVADAKVYQLLCAEAWAK